MCVFCASRKLGGSRSLTMLTHCCTATPLTFTLRSVQQAGIQIKNDHTAPLLRVWVAVNTMHV